MLDLFEKLNSVHQSTAWRQNLKEKGGKAKWHGTELKHS